MDNKENAASVTEHLSVQEIDEIRDLLEAGMQEEAEAQFLEVAGRLKKDDLYNAVGSLTRDLHESLLKFTEDDRLKTITNVEMPDASERLKTIINMTGEAANTTLDAVDACIPKIRDLVAVLEDLLPAWKELMKGQIDRNTFVALCHKVDTLINKIFTNNSSSP